MPVYKITLGRFVRQERTIKIRHPGPMEAAASHILATAGETHSDWTTLPDVPLNRRRFISNTEEVKDDTDV